MLCKENIPPRVIIQFQSNSQMNNNLIVSYIDYLNNLWVKNKIWRNSSMLVYDSFKGHLEKSIKTKFHESRVDLAVIPGELTSICQPLDVMINKLFKDNLRREWYTWMASGGAEETAMGNLRRAKISDVCLWVKRSQEGISDEIIIESFKTYEISIDLNESDSDLEIIDKDDDSDNINNLDDDDDINDDINSDSNDDNHV